MKIPVKFFKTLFVPSEPAEPNAVYFVQPDSDSPVAFYLTDEDGNLVDMFARRSTTPGLLSSVVVNLNEGTSAKQVLYTVPASRRAIITSQDLDMLSAVPTNAEFKEGWDNAANDVLTDPFHAADLINATAKSGPVLTPNARLVGTAGQVLGLVVTTPEGTVLTGRLNTFGYLTDVSGVPVPNIF